MFKLWYHRPITHTFAYIKINYVLIITVFVCAKAKECVIVRMPVLSSIKRQWVISKILTPCCSLLDKKIACSSNKKEDSINFFCMTLGIWRWDGEVGIFCLVELYVHINDYEIERDAQVIRSDLFYSFALAHTFEDFLLFPPNFSVFTLSVIFSLKICRFIW